MKRWHWVTGLAVLLTVGCSGQSEQGGPDRTPTPTPAPSVTPTPTPTVTPTPTLPPAPTTPALAALPLEGRNLKSCQDGHCRVIVRNGDRLTVPAAAGGTKLRIVSITAAQVKVEQSGYGGGTTSFTFFAPGPTGLGSKKFVVAFLDLKAGQAVLQVDV